MVTVLRADGLRVVTYVNDHLPAHVHVFVGGEAKINLFGTRGAPELVWADGMTRAEIRRAIGLVEEQSVFLLRRWEDIHGRVERRPD